MNTMKTGALAVSVVMMIGLARCGQSGAAHEDTHHPATLNLPDTVALAYRDTLLLPTRGDWLTIDRLVHDSRCPTGTTCVWEGNAEVLFSLQRGGNRHTFSLNTHPSFTTDSTLADLSIALLDLTPYPHIDSAYTTEQYEALLYISQ